MQSNNARLLAGVSLPVGACVLEAVLQAVGIGGASIAWAVARVGVVAALGVAGYALVRQSVAATAVDAFARGVADAEAERADEPPPGATQAVERQRVEITKACGLLDAASELIRGNAEQTLQAKALADEANETASRGVRELAAIGDAIEALNQSSDKVSQILRTIDRVAMETNILALNAAVEAARAGEAGAGFSVVADEVRRLAQGTADAARDTTAQIEETVSWIAQIEMLKAEVINTLNDIAEKSRGLAEMVGAVSEAASNEAQTVERVSAAIGALNTSSPPLALVPQPSKRGVARHAHVE